MFACNNSDAHDGKLQERFALWVKETIALEQKVWK